MKLFVELTRNGTQTDLKVISIPLTHFCNLVHSLKEYDKTLFAFTASLYRLWRQIESTSHTFFVNKITAAEVQAEKFKYSNCTVSS